MEISEIKEITEHLPFSELSEAAQSYINGHVAEGVALTSDTPVLVSFIIDSSQAVWAPTIESLARNIDAYTDATVALASVNLPAAAAVAGASGVAVLTAAGLDMSGVIDVEGFFYSK
jgi:hypothetical protein